MDEPDFVTMQEAADICRFKSVFAIRGAIRRRELPAIRLSHRHVVIPRAALYKWLESRRVRAIKPATNVAE